MQLVAMDVVQLFIYLGGAVASMALILHRLPHGWADVVAFATAQGQDKFAFINGHTGGSLAAFLTAPYTLLGGLLGGTFLTMASHGTDQLLVQRLLGCRTRWDSQRALRSWNEISVAIARGAGQVSPGGRGSSGAGLREPRPTPNHAARHPAPGGLTIDPDQRMRWSGAPIRLHLTPRDAWLPLAKLAEVEPPPRRQGP